MVELRIIIIIVLKYFDAISRCDGNKNEKEMRLLSVLFALDKKKRWGGGKRSGMHVNCEVLNKSFSPCYIYACIYHI